MNPITPMTAGLNGAPVSPSIRETAQDLEAAFLTEMLKYTGLGKGRESFGGGVGEEQFQSFLVEAHAKAMEARGGLGLAERLARALSQGAGE